MKIKKGDTVKVIAGKDKGKTGRVIEVLRSKNRVRVEGVGAYKRHYKPGMSKVQPDGGIAELNAPIHASNVMIVDPESGKATRVGYEIVDGKKVRVGRGELAGTRLDS